MTLAIYVLLIILTMPEGVSTTSIPELTRDECARMESRIQADIVRRVQKAAHRVQVFTQCVQGVTQ